MKLDTQACTRHTLSAGELAIVERCSCGAIHVTIGALTLRLAETAVASLATTLGEAARSLAVEQARQEWAS